MGVLLRVAEKLGLVTYRIQEPDRRTVARLQALAMPNVPQISPYDIQRFAHDGYRKNVAIYACIKFRMSGAMHVRMVAKQPGKKDALEELNSSHPLARLLRMPNPEQSQHEWLMEAIQHVDVGGTQYTHKLRPRAKSAPPVQLWNLRPDRIEAIPNDLGFIQAYHFPKERPNTPENRIPFQDVVQWMDGRDPLNDYYGLSKIAVLARQGDIDNETSDFMRSFLLNAGVPAAGLKYKTDNAVGQEERNRIEQLWRDKFGRSQAPSWFGEIGDGEFVGGAIGGQGNIAVLDADVEWIKMGSNFEELALDHVFGHTEARICSALGVPPICVGLKVGLDKATYSNAEQAEDAYWNNTGVPLYKGIAQKLTNGVASEFGDELVIEADFSEVRALQEDDDAKHTRTVVLWEKNLIRQDEARGELGWDPVGVNAEGVDTGQMFWYELVPKVSPPGIDPNEPEEEEEEDEPDPELDPEDEEEEQRVRRILERLALPKEPSWRRLHRAADSRAEAIKRGITKAIREARGKLELQSLINSLNLRDKSTVDVLTAEAWRDAAKPILTDRLTKHLCALFEAGGKAGTKAMTRHALKPLETFGAEANTAGEWALSRIGDLIVGISEETRKMVRQRVEDMFTEGVSARVMATRIRDSLGLTRPALKRLANKEKALIAEGFSGAELEAKLSRYTRRLIRNRALVIARTEGIRAVSEGQSSTWRQAVELGILPPDQTRFWITVEDERTCPICQPMDGQERKLGETFSAGDGGAVDAPPAHPQCRCALGLR